jgi:glycosyltransferase involved in cell wall biosynthesis
LPSVSREGLPRAAHRSHVSPPAVVASDCRRPAGIARPAATAASSSPAGDAPALAGALRRLLEEPDLRQRLAAAGRRQIETNFHIRETIPPDVGAPSALLLSRCAPPA